MYSQVPLNRHLFKGDTSLKQTLVVGPCHTSVIYFISLQGGHLSKGLFTLAIFAAILAVIFAVISWRFQIVRVNYW